MRWQREMKSKLTCSWYHSVAVGRGRFRKRYFDYGMVDSPACRFCGSDDETVEHVFFSCPMLSEAQKKLKTACENFKLQFNLKTLFTNKKLQRNVEEYLYEFFKEAAKDFFLARLMHDL